MSYEDKNWHSVETQVGLRNGLHMRPTTRIVEIAKGYKGEVGIENLQSKARADATSPMEVFMLEAYKDTPIRIYAERAEGCEKVVDAIRNIISSSEEN